MKQGDDDDGGSGVREVLMDLIKKKVTMKFASTGLHIGTLEHNMMDTKANYDC